MNDKKWELNKILVMIRKLKSNTKQFNRNTFEIEEMFYIYQIEHTISSMPYDELAGYWKDFYYFKNGEFQKSSFFLKLENMVIKMVNDKEGKGASAL